MMDIMDSEKQVPSNDQCQDSDSANENKSSLQLNKNVLLQRIVSNRKSLSPRRHMPKTLKVYEEQQRREVPGASKKTGTVMHAALTSEIDSADYKIDGRPMDIGMKVRNHALIHYIAKLAISNNENDTFDFAFVQSLLKNGADINAMDKYGQTVFHEVARSWNSDVAEFLLKNGASMNHQDKYGRAPLHVAAAVDYVEMVEFLVAKGADVNIRTTGELQAPIHFAAKNDACKSLKALISYGVDVNCRDYQERTPLQLAAAMSRSKAARLLIEMGVPAGVYDIDGEMALSLLVIKMPDVARLALDQLQSEDKINNKKYYFLNYLEGSRVVDGRSTARTPLEAAIVSESVDIIMHPVIQCLILTKWEKFGRRWAWFDFGVNVLSAVTWTIMGVTLPFERGELYSPAHVTWWRMVLASMALLLTFYEIVRQVVTTVRTKRSLTQWKNYRETSLSRDKPFCHPQWPDEKRYVDSEIKRVREYRWLASHDRWLYVDWVALLLIMAAAVSHAVFFWRGTPATHTVHVRIMCVLLIVIWVRILKFVRPFQGTGAFVASFTKMLADIFLSLFLIAIIFVPYASCFWIVFGGQSPRPAKGYSSPSTIIYEVFMLTVLDVNHDTEPFLKVDPFVARVLSCTYVSISFVIVLNLIIAMITDTFKRVFSYAQEHAAMERAKTILNIENSLRLKSRKLYWDHIRSQCSPLSLDRISRYGPSFQEIVNMGDQIREIQQIVEQRFAKRFGEGRISTLEEILKHANEVVTNYFKCKEMLSTVFRNLKSLEDMVAANFKPVEDKVISEANEEVITQADYVDRERGKEPMNFPRFTKSFKDLIDGPSGVLKRRNSTKSEPEVVRHSTAKKRAHSKRRQSTKSESDLKNNVPASKYKSFSKSTGYITKLTGERFGRVPAKANTKNYRNMEEEFEDEKKSPALPGRSFSKSAGHIGKSRSSSKTGEELLTEKSCRKRREGRESHLESHAKKFI